MPFEAFTHELAARPGIPTEGCGRKTLLAKDLGLDSLDLLEIFVLMDDLGAELVEQAAPSIQTLGDLYDHYLTRISAEPG